MSVLHHVLPTAAFAAFSSGSRASFMKRTSILKCGPDQLRALDRRDELSARPKVSMPIHAPSDWRLNLS